ncbi:hypothetical protein B0H10DRAFT_1299626 [Mycena sp. CBHHK59/15]|nr:hypothetical protein B0H10DRAFT_1299626 [Mycena sp. CBHHK59/15]
MFGLVGHPLTKCRALDYRKAIDDFVYHNRELRDLELSDADWNAIELVTEWLKVFRAATTEMSRTKKPMLSSTHTIFRGLREHLRNILRNLPNSVPSRLKRGLLEAHRKLSDYYYKSDESPYYTWAALLDPRISYAGLKHDFADEPELLDHLAESVVKMRLHFDSLYPRRDSDSPAPAALHITSDVATEAELHQTLSAGQTPGSGRIGLILQASARGLRDLRPNPMVVCPPLALSSSVSLCPGYPGYPRFCGRC